MEIIIGLAIGLGLAAVGFFIFKRQLTSSTEKDTEALLQTVEMKMKSLMPEVMSKAQEDLLKLAKNELGSEKKEIKTDLENKRGEIERMIKMVQQDLKNSQDTLNKAEKERVGSYKTLQTQLEEQRKITEQLKVSSESLRKVLSNNQMRGQFGEQVAEELLQMAGFVKGTHYEYNKTQATRDTRPDFTIYLPDKTKINIDVKFPYSNLQKAMEAEGEDKKSYLKLFETDVKEKIKQVHSRDYINPAENTVDFAIIFIPNEMIFSYIYDKLNEVWTEAMRKKIIFAGPFSFTAILRMVWQSYENFRFQSNIREIIANIQDVRVEFNKFFEEFDKVGDRIESLAKQYNTVHGTRARQVRRRLENIKNVELGEAEQPKLLDAEDLGADVVIEGLDTEVGSAE